MRGFLLNMAIPISQLPPDLVFGGQIDISNPIKRTKYERLNREWEQQQRTAAPSPAAISGPSPAITAFTQEKRERGQEFIGRFKTEFPAALGAIETELGLPQLRERAFTTGELVRGAPQRQTLATAGFDVTQSQLDRLIAADIAKLSPEAIGAGQQVQFGEAEFGRRAERAIKPFEVEAGFLGEEFKNEFDLFKTQIQGDLDDRLERIKIEGTSDLENLKQANLLAQIEQAAKIGSFTDLGDRYALINPFTGEEIQSFKKGIPPKIGTIGTWELD